MSQIILGIDPGSRKTGFACIEKGNKTVLLDQGVLHLIKDKKMGLEHRINILAQGLDEIFKTYKPDAVVIEKIFLSKNVDSAFKLGHARGVCLQKTAQYDASLVEFTPREVKKNIAGHGAALKPQVEQLLRQFFALEKPLAEDAADALALAMTYAHKGFSLGSNLADLGVRI